MRENFLIMVTFIIFLVVVAIYVAWNYSNVKAHEEWVETLSELTDEELIEEAEEVRSEREFMGYNEYFETTDALRKEFESRGLEEKFNELEL